MDFDIDHLVDVVTKEILRRIGESDGADVLITDGCPGDVVSEKYGAAQGTDPGCCKYVLLTAEAYKALLKGCGVASAPESGGNEESSCCCCGGEAVDLRGKRLLHERDLRDHNVQRDTVVRVSKKTIITALAHDYAKGLGVKIVRES
jgi:hypothetical protein